jgi:isoleucyl-tRNA synthetase
LKNKESRYEEYKEMNFPAFEQSVLKYWADDSVFDKSIANRKDAPPFTFYEGPPSANGLPGIHHVMSRTLKDIFCRYKTLKGFQVKRKGGWDTHGLPVELQVEKSLGITKEDIGKKISIAEYNRACRNDVLKYKDVWDRLTERIGFWLDLEHPYVTYENTYIESLWYLLKELYDKNFLYKGYTIQPYSPAAGTGLSSHELNQQGTYRMVKDTTVVAQFKVIRDGKSEFLYNNAGADLFILAWTTTPWTLPSNTALAVGEKISYAEVRTFNQYTFEPIVVILARDLAAKYFSEGWEEIASPELKEFVSAWLSSGELNPEFKKALAAEDSAMHKEFAALVKARKVPFSIMQEVKGKELLGIHYEQLLPFAQPEKESGDAFRVITGDFVSTEDGTGIVHIAPTFGADDMRVAKQSGIAPMLVRDENGKLVPLVDLRGRFRKEMEDKVFGLAGEFVKEEYLGDAQKSEELKKQQEQLKSLIPKLDKYLSVDERLVLKLKLEGKAFKIEKYEHTYPHCWRTDKPLLYYPLESWFIKTTAVKERMVELNKTINWKPESTGSGRFGNWLENLVDWNLSRSRYWGTPLPIWRTEDGLEEICIGSLKQLSEEVEKAMNAGFMNSNPVSAGKDFDLHRPYVDEIFLVSASGKKMTRETDLIDVWFDSGAMPYAQWHYPFENVEIFKQNFPADYIAEGVDQTRGWFFTLHAISVMLFDSIAYRNVISNGLVLDKEGNKMSKRVGNVVDPFSTIEKYGADATRWYLLSNAQPWDNLKFDIEGLAEGQRKFFGTLYNVYSFFALYANIDGFKYAEKDIDAASRPEIDRWILSLLNSLIQQVESSMDEYEPTRATRAIQEFVNEHLSNWYVRLCRRRFWKGDYTTDKISAYQTLYTCLETVAKLMSSFSPFYAEQLYRDLNNVSGRDNAESVHLSNFPEVEAKLIDTDLEQRMQLAQDISSMALSLRKKVGIRVRQPLHKILIPLNDKETEARINQVRDLILSEVNVKELEYIYSTTGFITKRIKPNFKALGPKAGAKMKQLAAAITELGQEDIAKMEGEGSLDINLDGTIITLTAGDVEIISEDIPGWQVATAGKLTVALDITVTDELKQEGLARELINRLQNLRKDSGLEVTDRINVNIKSNDLLNDALNNYKNYICAEILADNLQISDSLPEGVEVDLDEIRMMVNISKNS